MKDLTKFLSPILTENLVSNAIYEIIENEVVEGRVIKGLDISGSLFSLTKFVNCTFDSCVFFGSRIENCDFSGCTFKDCNFQFSTIENTNFIATAFKNCNWELSPIKACNFDHAFLDTKTAYYAHKANNLLTACSSEKALDWGEALSRELPLNQVQQAASNDASLSKLEETVAFYKGWKQAI